MKKQNPFNPIGPIAYFLTFRTYGSWLHGEEKGSVDRKLHNIPGTPFLQPNEALVSNERNSCKQSPVIFNWRQRKLIEQTIGEVCEHNKWLLHAVNARMEHIHVVVTAIKPPEPIMNSLKSWCTRKLRENKLLAEDTKPWSRHGSTRYLWDEKALHDTCRYVLEFQDDKPDKLGMVHKDALPYGRASE